MRCRKQIRPIKKKQIRAAAFIITFISAAVFLMINLERAIKPIAIIQGKHYAELTASNIVSECVSSYLQKSSYEYDFFAAVLYDESGKASSIEAIGYNINKVQSELTMQVNKSLAGNKYTKEKIPVGSLTNSYLMAGKGPNVPMRICPVGKAEVRLTSNFTSAGINQTCHRISAVITVEMKSSLPLYSFTTESEFEFLLAETVIVGKVPTNNIRLME